MRRLRERLADGRGPADEFGETGGAWDLVVVGAGISGAGVARDAAMRGMRVLVLEANDVAFGTSSRSSRLIHGGVRYLEQGQVRLVYEALRERALLYRLAGHLVRPARFLFPSYAGDRLRPWKLRIGLTLYDLLALWRSEGYRYLRPGAALEKEPALSPQGLLGAVEYEDAVTDDARLTLTVLQSAREHGAEVLTYEPVEGIEGRDGDFTVRTASGLGIRTRGVMLCTGPWTGARLLGEPGVDLVAKSKGIHLVVRAEDVPVQAPVVVQAPGSRRILFVVPWGTRTYLGTTDTAYEGDPGRSGIEGDDEQSVLDVVKRVVPAADLRPDRIISAWSGVRPLVRAQSRRRIRSGSTVELARTHRVVTNEAGVMALVGGKLTTYREMAEQAVDAVIDQAVAFTKDPTLRARLTPCSTDSVPLVPGQPLSEDELVDELAHDLVDRHGPRTRDMVVAARRDPALAERLYPDLPYRWIEVEHAITHEGIQHLHDLLRRRLPIALTASDLGAAVAHRVAERLVDAQGGSSADVKAELERYRERVRIETSRDVQLVVPGTRTSA